MPSPFPGVRDLPAHPGPTVLTHAARVEAILDALAASPLASISTVVVEILDLWGDDSYDALEAALADALPHQLLALEVALGLRPSLREAC